MECGRKILNYRMDQGLPQQTLARLCGVTASALSKIEHGTNAPRSDLVLRISRVLCVTVEELLDESHPYPYQP